MKKKVAFYTAGCRLNQSETAVLTDRFTNMGYEQVAYGEPTDVLVLNTCSVTENAEADCRRVIRRTLRHSPRAFVTVTGCYAQTGLNTLQHLPGVDLVLGNQYKMLLPDYLEEMPHVQKRASTFVRHSGSMSREDFVQDGVGEYATTRANLKIQDGCNFMCSFCLIPFARGRERSRLADDAVREAERLVERGHRELVLTGVNVGRFANGSEGLLDLIQRLERIPGLARIRISSIEPTTIPDALLEYMSTSRKLCRFLHVPLQSGHDGILSAMNRRYTVSEYRAWVEDVVQKIPDVCVGTDVLVGFPGETDREFSATCDVVRDLPLAYAHVFSYSTRPGTPAARLGNPVPSAVIKTRSRLLSRLSATKRAQFYQRFLDRDCLVLFESMGKDGLWTGLTDNFIRVSVVGSGSLANQIRQVRLTGVMDHAALGKLADEEPPRPRRFPIPVFQSFDKEAALPA
ncbi:MAG: tRNA (N(6)-L-threonylcarbamoyladenosine(37)-C(2))-methylthiotransferase MtaB [Nitrospira sp. SB0672_bin_25]|nr:tRNA (N(6)-L-threonylcarbamoyladenosine(37)-C(2))-methylthiotransferase MtaB [Nitrospira sp. SB0666_bin_27]MYF25272.1 tRNA (N(6)-L-threonylcarbamoyladenosine(37)-C(2))-methylthiotransferase MtaB [Nitrospira sp. SB0678_bin_10]MYJ54522.1 tRNA (N(6)-L-threonylcarbamoyladenosine(37)-C(2))-methylthiotransferase MtaB [Nitrospira sp. SB0672_bin_25]